MNKLLILISYLIVTQACNYSRTSQEEKLKQKVNIKWTGLRANFYNNDSLNQVRRHLFAPTIFYDLMCVNESSDTICIHVNAVDDETFVEDKLYVEVPFPDLVKRIRVSGYLSPDEVCIFPNSTKRFTFSTLLDEQTLEKIDRYGYSQIFSLISEQERLLYNHDKKTIPIKKDNDSFQILFRDSTDMSVE